MLSVLRLFVKTVNSSSVDSAKQTVPLPCDLRGAHSAETNSERLFTPLLRNRKVLLAKDDRKRRKSEYVSV